MKHAYDIYGVRLQNNSASELSFVMRVEALNKADAVAKAVKDSFLFGSIYIAGSGFAVRSRVS